MPSLDAAHLEVLSVREDRDQRCANAARGSIPTAGPRETSCDDESHS
jgi:hypothetical protein